LAAGDDERPLITAIVGGGRGCEAILRMVNEDTLGRFRMSIVGVADRDPDAPGVRYAREMGTEWVTTDYRDLYAIPDLDLIIELTGSDRVRDELEHTRPRHVRLIDNIAARLFWELHQAEEAIIEQRSKDFAIQREIEAELVRTRAYLQNILDNAPVMIITTDPDGRIVSFNGHAEACYGYDAKEVVGKPVTVLFGSPEEWEPLLRRVKQGGTVQEHETTRVRKDGSQMIVSVTLAQLKDDAGNMIGTVAMSRDITQRQLLMNQVIENERLAAIGRLAAGVAHEINNPLAVIAEISGYLEDLVAQGPPIKRREVDRELQEGLPKISAQIRRCRSITSRLLSFGRKSEARMDVADVSVALNEALPFLAKEARHAGVQIHRRLTCDIPRVSIEELQLEEVFTNFIQNAIDAMSPRGYGNIWLFSEQRNARVILTIKDDGPGIAQDIMGRLFDPFVTTKPVGQGTGLGLSICYGIVKHHGGDILVDSEPGIGTTFRIALPVHHEGGPGR
jgi:two-component system NtrC family sensor kinase